MDDDWRTYGDSYTFGGLLVNRLLQGDPLSTSVMSNFRARGLKIRVTLD